MAKKTTEKDVLIVRDEKTGEISVVAGLNADGSPKRTPAKAENAQSFLQFDRHGDVLDNFFKNFFRQCKEPSRFGFYRVAADQADKLLEVIKDLLKDPEGNVSLVPHFIRKEQKLDEYKEHKFSDDDRKNLRETGNLGRVVDIVDRETGEIIPSYVSIDRKTNEITDIPANRVRIPERIGKTEITTQERDMLRAGLPVRDKLIERNDGRKFVTTLQVNVEQRGVEFVPGTGKSPRTAQTQETKGDTSRSQVQGGENAAQAKKEQRRNTWTNEDGSIRPISKWSGVSFTDQQKADYVAGKAVKLENVTDKQGFHATMYIKFNPEKGRPYRYDTNPDNAQQVAPSNESRTQVAVNNDGKTNEATKNLREPLQKGQTNPKDARQQQQQEKPQKKTGKGMKM